jgi:hypothetical protein
LVGENMNFFRHDWEDRYNEFGVSEKTDADLLGTVINPKEYENQVDVFNSVIDFKNIKTVLEIGPGYGELCKRLLSRFTGIQSYVLVDHPVMLNMAKQNIGDNDIVKYEPVFEIESINDKYDLFISSHCLSETTKEFQNYVLENIFKMCNSVVVIECLGENGIGDDFEKRLKDKMEYLDDYRIVPISKYRKQIMLLYGLKPKIKEEIKFIGSGLSHYDNNDIDANDEQHKIESIRQNILPHIQKYLHGKLVDVGCGNGRLNAVLCDKVDRIVGYDAYRKINDIYWRDNFEIRCLDFVSDLNERVSVVLFFGSFYMMSCYGYKKVLNKCYSVLDDGGHVIIVDSPVRNTKEKADGCYSINDLCKAVNFKVVKKVITVCGGLIILEKI